jgi:iron-sulfur cluster repair protein YtfE (RIC family)
MPWLMLCSGRVALRPAAAANSHDLAALVDEFGKIRIEVGQSEERTKRHFDLTVETIRHDLLGANRDEIETLKDRITRVERHLGFAAR